MISKKISICLLVLSVVLMAICTDTLAFDQWPSADPWGIAESQFPTETDTVFFNVRAGDAPPPPPRWYDPDGNEVDMCGNGARCIAQLAFELGAAPAGMIIETRAGPVHANVLSDGVCLELPPSADMTLDLDLGLDMKIDFINTGVPHTVAWVDDVQAVDLIELGRAIRHHERFAPEGTNADFAKVESDGTLTVRTYERGVEAETLACGTGAAAVALVAARRGLVALPVAVHCASGCDLVINSAEGRTTLSGNAVSVFDGEIEYGNRL